MNLAKEYIEEIIRSNGYEVFDGLWIVWLASFLLIVSSVLFFLAVVISRYRKDYIARWELDFNLQVEPLLLALIYGGYPTYEDWKEANVFDLFEKKYLNSNRGKKSFIHTIAVLRSRLNGEDASRLAELYRNTGLYRTSLAALQSRRWHIKAAGIQELGALNYVEAVLQIRKFSDHPHEVVRSMAQLVLIKLDDTDPFGFLDNLRNPISQNTMIRLHGAMLQKTSLEIKTFDRWLKSQHPDVVLFATTMAGLFNTASDVALLAQLVKHPFSNIAKAAIISLEQLGAQDTLTKLIPDLLSAPMEVQVQLILSLGKLGFSDEKIIKDWLQSDSFEIVKVAYELYQAVTSRHVIDELIQEFPGLDQLSEIKKQEASFNLIQQP